LGIVAQRLVRKVCSFCSEVYVPTKEEVEFLNIPAQDMKYQDWHKGKGCEHCFGSGYLGREAIFELLNVTPPVRKIMAEGNQSKLFEYLIEHGYESFFHSGRNKISTGITTLEEALRVLPRQMFTDIGC